MTNGLTAAALAGIGRYFIGGFDTGGSAWSKNRQPSKYEPHQGKQEMARRVRQGNDLRANGNRAYRQEKAACERLGIAFL